MTTPIRTDIAGLIRRLPISLLLLLVPVRTYALEAADLVGFWKGTASGEVLPQPIDVTLDLWVEDGKLGGILGDEFGACLLDSAVFKGDQLMMTFYREHLGPGTIVGKIDENKLCTFEWIIGDASGTGQSQWQPPPEELLKPEEIAGIYSGMAGGPLNHEDFPLTVELTLQGDQIGGIVFAPIDKFAIEKVRRMNNRFVLQCRSADDLTGIIVAGIKDGEFTASWSGASYAGRAKLTKKPAGFQHPSPPNP